MNALPRNSLSWPALFVLFAAALLACSAAPEGGPAVPQTQPPATSASSAASAEPVDKPLAALAADIVRWLDSGDNAEVFALFDQDMRKAMSEQQLAELWPTLEGHFGELIKQLGTREKDKGGYHAVLVTCQFDKAVMDVRLVFDGERHLAGIQVTPSNDASAYGPRPQTPKPPFPYAEREVLYDNPGDGSKIGGTLTVPAGEGRHPAVLLITGSGAQDRDETLFGHKPFLVIADHLSRHGIAVLRVDDRGVGKSTGEPTKATIDSHGGDVDAGIAFLARQPEVDAGKIGLIGHSEGGILAALVAARSPKVAFIISLAGTGLPGTDINPMQVEAMLRATGGLSEQAVADIVAAQRKLMKLVASDASDEAIDQELRKTLEAAANHAPPEAREQALAAAQSRVAAEGKMLKSPWFRSFLKHDPRTSWRKVRCPALALVGSKDTQVPPAANLKAIAAALKQAKNADATTTELPGLNHLFQVAGTGLVDEYGKIEQTIDPAVLDLITEWIEKRTGG